MGAAILLLHYTGMAAATFNPNSESVERVSADNTGMVVIVAVVTFIVLGVATFR